MNDLFYAGFTISARIFGFSSAVAAMALYSGVFTFTYILFLSIGTRLPHIEELVYVVSLCSIVSTIMHGGQFGLPIIKMPAWDKNLRFINDCILTQPSIQLRNNLTLAELNRLQQLLLKLPKKNGWIGAFWALLIVGSVLPYSIWRGFEVRQLAMVCCIGVTAVGLHGMMTNIFSELAIARILSECRRHIRALSDGHREVHANSMSGKFLILGYAFITALVTMFALVYFGRDNLGAIFMLLIYNIFLMFFLGYLVLYRINSSLREIRQAATNLRDGTGLLTYSRALDAEFVDIADGLNSATLAIQDHQQNLESRIVERTRELTVERDKSEKLLLNILPAPIAEELKLQGFARPVKFDSVTVIFTDFVGFTKIAETLSPEELISELDKCFSYFDSVTEKYHLEKLKTIGDAFMCAGGIPEKNYTHAIDAALAALEIQAFMNQMKEIKRQQGFPYWELRLGMHAGELIAGVIGEKKFAYDVWGDTVNTASRLESSGTPGHINISKAVYEKIRYFFRCEYRGKVQAKNKGEIDMYYLLGLKPAFSISGLGKVPNADFLRFYDAIQSGKTIVARPKRPLSA